MTALVILNVSSPGTIVLTTGIIILGFVRSTTITWFKPFEVNLERINVISSKMSS
jgi:hypothetical protein